MVADIIWPTSLRTASAVERQSDRVQDAELTEVKELKEMRAPCEIASQALKCIESVADESTEKIHAQHASIPFREVVSLGTSRCCVLE